MDNGLDALLPQEAAEQLGIADVADDELGRLGDGPLEAGGQIVEHDDRLAGINQLQHHMAADIAGSAGDQDRHFFNSSCTPKGLALIRRHSIKADLATTAVAGPKRDGRPPNWFRTFPLVSGQLSR